MRVHLVNPSDVSFGVGVITPRWLYVLAGATPRSYGDPVISDETLESFQIDQVAPGDVVGIGIHTSNAWRGYEIGRLVKEQGGLPVFGGIHATLFPEEPLVRGGAAAVVRGDGDLAWADVLSDCAEGKPKLLYEGGSIEAADFAPARWDLVPKGSYMWGSVQTVRGCPKHCSFCSVWRTDGQAPRQRPVDPVVDEVVELRRQVPAANVLVVDDGSTDDTAGVARRAGASVLMLTAQPQAPLPQQADWRVYLPAQTMAEAEASSSAQAMGSAFEQALWILFDALVPRLQAATGQRANDVRQRHTNLE